MFLINIIIVVASLPYIYALGRMRSLILVISDITVINPLMTNVPLI